MSRVTLCISLIIGVTLVMTNRSIGQELNVPVSDFQIATEELDTILAKSENIQDLRKRVSVRSKAAGLLWSRDPDESRRIFSKLWKEIDKYPEDKSFNKENSRIDLLEQLYPRDRQLANRLIAETSESHKSSDPLFDKLQGTNPETRRLAFLSYRMAEEDSVMAAAILELSLSENTAPSLPLILNRIRESNPMLANYVATQALERFQSQSPTFGLYGLVHAAAYLFPMSPSPYISTKAAESDEILRQEFMRSGYLVFKQSLIEKDEDLVQVQNLSQQALNVRRFNQVAVAGILIALSPRYAPEYYVELNAVNVGLMQSIPKQYLGLISMQVAAVNALLGKVEKSELSDAEIINAIAKEDFFTAETLIKDIREGLRKKTWLNILFRSQAKAFMSRGEPHLALTAARKMENPVMSVPILIEIVKFANKKRDEPLSIMALQAAQAVTEKLKKGMQAKMMFEVAAEIAYLMPEQASTMIQTSVETVNGLSEIKDEIRAYTGENFWSDPDNFLNTSSMNKAFAVYGEHNMSETLLIAHRFHDNSLQMMAKLATVERVLRKGPPKTEPKKKAEKPAMQGM